MGGGWTERKKKEVKSAKAISDDKAQRLVAWIPTFCASPQRQGASVLAKAQRLQRPRLPRRSCIWMMAALS
jgi:hypothetical protein